MKITKVIISILVITQGITFYLCFSLNNSHQKLAAELDRVNSSLNNSHQKLAAEFDRVNSSFKEEKAQLTQTHEKNIARIDESIRYLSKPPTVEEVAVSLMKTLSAELVALLAEKLSNSEVYVEKLRGEPGNPRPEEIAQYLMTSKSAELVALLAEELSNSEVYVEKLRGKPGNPPGTEKIAQYMITSERNVLFPAIEREFWKQRKTFILENPRLIADIAEAVYQTYGNSLKGQKGQDAQKPSPEEIARVLSNDYGFAQLVADFKK